MPRAVVRESEGEAVPCGNCGLSPCRGLEVVTGSGAVALRCCQACWPRVVSRGQLDVVRDLCRRVDVAAAPPRAPVADVAAMLGMAETSGVTR